MTTLAVVSTGGWRAEELTGVDPDVGVEGQHGFFLRPPDAPRAWWAPVEWMARARRAGVHDPLVAPGADLLPRLRRDVAVVTGLDLPSGPEPLFAKPAEFKHDDLPAKVWPSADAFSNTVRSLDLPDDSLFHVTHRILDFDLEVRCYVVGGTVLTASTYLVDDDIVQRQSDDSIIAAAQAQAMVNALGPDQPVSYVLDVGLTDRSWVPIEVNPTWSSDWYACDRAAVIHAICAANTDADYPWTPDPYLVAKADRQGLMAKA